MLAHLTLGTVVGLVAAIAAGFSGFGVVGIVLTYSAVGTFALLGSATIAAMREDARDMALAAAQ